MISIVGILLLSFSSPSLAVSSCGEGKEACKVGTASTLGEQSGKEADVDEVSVLLQSRVGVSDALEPRKDESAGECKTEESSEACSAGTECCADYGCGSEKGTDYGTYCLPCSWQSFGYSFTSDSACASSGSTPAPTPRMTALPAQQK